MNKILCATRFGLDARIVEVEVSFIRGLPSFTISGLASSAIQESKQRVQAALSSLNFSFPPLKITINLSPSDLPKYGSHFDLPIALLIATHKSLANVNNQWFAFGELGLDGRLRHGDGLFPLILDTLLKYPDACIILPEESREYFSFVPNLRAAYANNLKEAIEILHSDEKIDPTVRALDFPNILIDGEPYFYKEDFNLDFLEVKNQEMAKRAALIAAAGFHNIILEGSPGCGKSMIIKRLVEILPPVSLHEMIEMAKLRSLGREDIALRPTRSFKSPHQSASKASIIGSVSNNEPKPGEIALAHLGVLFFDELPYFGREVLEALREPLENNMLLVSRVHSKIEYPSSFLFAAALNPCPCGNLLSPIKECRCKDTEIIKYKNRLSEPFLDRIDLFVQMSETQNSVADTSNLDSTKMRQMVFDAFRFQKMRKQEAFNGKLDEKGIAKFCVIDKESEEVLQKAVDNLGFSMRLVNKVKKVARTIADLEQSKEIKKSHILEAMSYRRI